MRRSAHSRVIGLAVAALAALPALADERAREAEDFVREYVRLWNAGDAAAITSRIYRFDAPNNPMGTAAGLQRQFDQLKAQGYARSETLDVNGCLVSDNAALVELRYSRLKTDGTAMPPRERATLYQLRKSADGWRITELIPMDWNAKLNCTSALATK
jgi:ketosteroid isomerase-like protein